MSDPKLNLVLSADDKTAAAFGALNDRLKNVERTTKRTSDSFKSFGRVAAGVFAGIQVTEAVRSTVNLADSYKNVNARLKIVSRSTEEFTTAQTSLFNIAQKTRTGLQETTDLYAQLARGTADMRLPQQTMLQLTEGINKAVTLSGSSVQAANAALVQLSQGFAAGALRGQEFMSVQEQAPVILETVRKGLNLTQGELKKLAEEGKLTNELFIKGFFGGMSGLNFQFDQLPVTVEGAMRRIRNSFLKSVGEIDTMTGASQSLADAFTKVSESLGSLSDWYSRNGSNVGALLGIAGGAAASSMILSRVAAIGGVTAALATMKGALIGVAGVFAANPVLAAFLLAGTAFGASITARAFESQAEAVTRLKDEISSLSSEIDRLGSKRVLSGSEQRTLDIALARIKSAKSELFRAQGGKVDLMAYQDMDASAKYPKKPVAVDANLAKQQQSFLAGLQKQYDALVYSERDLVEMEAKRLGVNVQQALSLFDQAQAVRDVDAASKAASEEAKKRLQDIMAAGKEQDANNERQQNVIAGFRNQMQAYQDMLAVRSSGALLSQEEIAYQERLNQLNKSYAAARLQIEKVGGVYMDENLEKLYKEYDINREIIKQIKEKAVAQKNDLFGGFTSGMNTYFQEITDFAKFTEDATVRAFKGMEDALVTFVQTGKLNFGDLARSIIADIARIYVRQTMIAPILGAIGGAFGGSSVSPFSLGYANATSDPIGTLNYMQGWTGQKRAMGGPVTAGKTYLVGERGPELFTAQSSGQIMPNGSGGSGVVVNQTINVSTGVQQTVRAEVMSLMPQIAGAAKAAVADAKLRGGSYAAAMR